MSTANRIGILKEANKRLVLSCIRSFGPISHSEIILKTRLSRPTVSNIVQELIEERLVEQTGYAESLGGRSPALFSFNPKSYFTIGVEFEFPFVRMVIADLNNEPMCSLKIGFSLNDEKSFIINTLLDSIVELIRRSGLPEGGIIGIGLGLPGIINYKEGTSVFIERIRGWRDVPLKQILEERLGIPVYLRNDVHLMSLIENGMHMKHLSNSTNSFIYIGMRHSMPQHGIGMSIIMNGSIYEGYKGNAGFIGHITVDPHGPQCVCGNFGCLETFVGERAIKKYLNMKDAEEDSTDGDLAQATLMLKDLVTMSKQGDLHASEVLREAGYYLGLGIANVVKLFEIPTVVVGGIPDIEGSVFLKSMREVASKNLYPNVRDELQIVGGRCYEEHYPLGGCLLVVEESFKEPELNVDMNNHITHQ